MLTLTYTGPGATADLNPEVLDGIEEEVPTMYDAGAGNLADFFRAAVDAEAIIVPEGLDVSISADDGAEDDLGVFLFSVTPSENRVAAQVSGNWTDVDKILEEEPISVADCVTFLVAHLNDVLDAIRPQEG